MWVLLLWQFKLEIWLTPSQFCIPGTCIDIHEIHNIFFLEFSLNGGILFS